MPGILLTYNLFAYCLNNPVNHDDPNGTIIPLIIAAIASAPAWLPVVVGVTTAVIAGITGSWFLITAINETRQNVPDPRAEIKGQGKERTNKNREKDNFKDNSKSKRGRFLTCAILQIIKKPQCTRSLK